MDRGLGERFPLTTGRETGCLGSADPPYRQRPAPHLPTGEPKVTAAAMVEGQPFAVTVHGHRKVLVVDLTTGQQVGEPLTGHVDQVWDVATAVIDGRPVAVTGGADQIVRVWGLATKLPVGQRRTRHSDWVTSVVTATLDGRPVAVTGSRDKTWSCTSLA